MERGVERSVQVTHASAIPAQPESVRAHLALRRLKDLPAFSPQVNELLEVLSDENADIERLSTAIENCPGLTARVLGLANSAYFALRNPVRTVADAVRVLGFNVVRSVGLAIIVQGPLDLTRCPRFQAERFWMSALLCGLLSRKAAELRAIPELDPDWAYLSGLLHTLGLPALVHLFPEEMNEILAAAAEADEVADGVEPPTLCQREAQRLGIDHRLAGAHVMERWGLPPLLARAARHHHDVEYRGEQWPLCLLVGLCSDWAEDLVAGVPEVALDAPVRRLLHLSEEQAGAVYTYGQQMLEPLHELARGLGQG